jgi:putative spermidine/putrescine transport system ATP-binding protein
VGASVDILAFKKRYGSVDIVKALTLRIKPGEFMTLLGPSGSGKTTTLSAVAGFVTLTEGDILINGESVKYVPPEARNLGVVFQHYALFPHLTVAENISFPLEMRMVSSVERRERVVSALEAVQMEKYSDRYPSQLSGGQQQRIALARAMVFQPHVLLLDEPLGALDKNLRDYMQIELKRLHARTSVTMIYVTHDQEEALLLSDRIALLNLGNLEQVGTPKEIYGSPKNRFVAEFIGESNFVRGIVRRQDDAGTVIEFDGDLKCEAQQAGYAVGSPVNIMIRNEHVIIGPESASMHNSYCGRVAERFFAGAKFKYRLETKAGTSIAASLQRTPENAPSVGDEVQFAWRREDVVIFPLNSDGNQKGEMP